MKKPDYTPQPIDTSDIVLDDDIANLIESMAKNVHEVWAANRIAEGWHLGPRNDELKTHPCLVPYEELPEVEKQYDRNTAIGTLKFIIAQGYQITKQ